MKALWMILGVAIGSSMGFAYGLSWPVVLACFGVGLLILAVAKAIDWYSDRYVI